MMAAPEILPPEARAPLLPLRDVVIVSRGQATVPHPRGGSARIAVRPGVRISWAPLSLTGGALLALFGGEEADAGIAIALDRPGLRQLIADLQSIDAQLGEPI